MYIHPYLAIGLVMTNGVIVALYHGVRIFWPSGSEKGSKVCVALRVLLCVCALTILSGYVYQATANIAFETQIESRGAQESHQEYWASVPPSIYCGAVIFYPDREATSDPKVEGRIFSVEYSIFVNGELVDEGNSLEPVSLKAPSYVLCGDFVVHSRRDVVHMILNIKGASKIEELPSMRFTFQTVDEFKMIERGGYSLTGPTFSTSNVERERIMTPMKPSQNKNGH